MPREREKLEADWVTRSKAPRNFFQSMTGIFFSLGGLLFEKMFCRVTINCPIFESFDWLAVANLEHSDWLYCV